MVVDNTSLTEYSLRTQIKSMFPTRYQTVICSAERVDASSALKYATTDNWDIYDVSIDQAEGMLKFNLPISTVNTYKKKQACRLMRYATLACLGEVIEINYANRVDMVQAEGEADLADEVQAIERWCKKIKKYVDDFINAGGYIDEDGNIQNGEFILDVSPDFDITPQGFDNTEYITSDDTYYGKMLS